MITLLNVIIYASSHQFKKKGEREREEKRRSEGLRELRTQPVTSCKAADRLCRTLISMYKYIHSTLAFGRVTALLTRVVQILKNRAVKEQENPCGFDVNAFSVAGRHYRLMLVKLLKTSKCQDRL